MGQIKFLNIPERDRAVIFDQASNVKNMPSFAVEKDWWVVQALSAIFEMEIAEHLVFKGGTSLSKAWSLIQRFSEDIDLAIDRSFFGFAGVLSKNQRTALRKEAGAYTGSVFYVDLQKKFEERGIKGLEFNLVDTKDSDQDPRIIEIYYPNVIKPKGYLEPKIQIELGCRSLREPFTHQTFTSFVDEVFVDRDFTQPAISVPSVNPERTFLEKVFLLHEEFQKPVTKIRVDRLSRHLYDVYHLSKTPYADDALKNQELYEAIVHHRHEFTRIGGINYNYHGPQTINPLPLQEVIDEWRADYGRMLEEMIYESDPPNFDVIIEGLTTLRSKINSLTWEIKTVYRNPNSTR